MLTEFDFYINKGTVEVENKTFKLGELTCDFLNIKPDEFTKMWNLSKKIEKTPTQKDVQELHDLLKKEQYLV